MRFATRALQVGQAPEAPYRPVIQPVFQSATFAWESLDSIPPVDYSRCTNPNRIALEQVLASMEGAAHCVSFSSGMAAISAALSRLEQGDHLLMASDIYGGTFRLAHQLLPRQGVEVSEFSPADLKELEAAFRPNTRMLVYETPSNPNLRIFDIAAIAEIAAKRGVTTVFDNTFASPALQNPISLGVSMVVHSTTKYISGHSDVIGGAVITDDPEANAWVYEWNKTVGASPSPFDCWLSLRGVKTLSCRMERHCKNAMRVAEYLAAHSGVAKVHYPGLKSHPDHALASRQMADFGGMVSFEVAGTAADARKVCESTSIFRLAESLGGVESLVGYPPLMSHASMTEQQRCDRGIPPTLIRLSVGIEDAQDLVEDLGAALAATTPAYR